jgi:hypothetical protein
MSTTAAGLNLFSPGAQTSARARLELRLDRAGMAALRQFLGATGREALASPAEFSAGRVHGQWDATVVAAFTSVMGDFLGVTGRAAGRDEHLRALAARLAGSPLPGEVFTSARAVLADGGGRAAMTEAMAADSGQTALTAALSVFGRTWATVVSQYARVEATAGFNSAVVRQALRAGVTQIVWVAHHDERTRPTHLAADGQKAKPGGHYIVGGAVLRWPGDVAGPYDETMNCRCVLAAAGDRPPGYELPPRSGSPAKLKPQAARPELSGQAAAEGLRGPVLDSGPARRALLDYTSGLYGQINYALRNGRPLDRDLATIPELLTDLARAHPLPFPIMMHRGVSANFPIPAVGDVVQDPAPLSGTLSAQSVRNFGPVTWSIHVPQGYPAIPVSQLQKGPSYEFEGPGVEDEIILPPGTRLRILSVTASTVEAEVVQP